IFCFSVYVNHRPAFGLSPMELHDAFNHLGEPSDEGFQINRDQLLALLQNKGIELMKAFSAKVSTTLGDIFP
ncbi:predicted protein, partial [Nematostella vectensis]